MFKLIIMPLGKLWAGLMNGLGFKTVLAMSAAIVLPFLEHLGVLFQSAAYIGLVVLILVDLLTGVWLGVQTKQFSSSRFRQTVIKLIMYSVMLATSHILGSIHAIFVTILLEDGVLIFLAATEAISVLENCSRITGMPIPAWLSKKLRGIASNPTEKK